MAEVLEEITTDLGPNIYITEQDTGHPDYKIFVSQMYMYSKLLIPLKPLLLLPASILLLIPLYDMPCVSPAQSLALYLSSLVTSLNMSCLTWVPQSLI